MKKGIKREEEKTNNQFNQINQLHENLRRSNQSFQMRGSVAKAAREYARRALIPTGQFAEKAFINYMETHPLDSNPLLVENVVESNLLGRVEQTQMTLIEKKMRLILERLSSGVGDAAFLRESLAKEIKRGTRIKKPSEPFVALLEEAVKHI